MISLPLSVTNICTGLISCSNSIKSCSLSFCQMTIVQLQTIVLKPVHFHSPGFIWQLCNCSWHISVRWASQPSLCFVELCRQFHLNTNTIANKSNPGCWWVSFSLSYMDCYFKCQYKSAGWEGPPSIKYDCRGGLQVGSVIWTVMSSANTNQGHHLLNMILEGACN